MMVINYFTKWPEAIAIPDQTAPIVAEALVEHIVSRFGCPLQIHSDQGRNFESEVLQATMKILGSD
jgi:hypothetical protein